MEREINVTIGKTLQKFKLLVLFDEKLEECFKKKNIKISQDSTFGKALRGKVVGDIGSYVIRNENLVQFHVRGVVETNNKNSNSKTIGIGNCLVQHSSVERGSWDN